MASPFSFFARASATDFPDPVLLDQLDLLGRLDHLAWHRGPGAEDIICLPGRSHPFVLFSGLGEDQIQAFRLLSGNQFAHGGR